MQTPSLQLIVVLFCAALPLTGLGCSASPHPADAADHEDTAAPAEAADEDPMPGAAGGAAAEHQAPATGTANDTPHTFGESIDPATNEVSLTQLVADPAAYDGQRIRSSGTVTAVCQRMGCWMELSDDAGNRVRVPMAGHRFFLPRDISGRRAAVEGTVAIRELSQAERDHLASEGAEATSVALEISATGVALSPIGEQGIGG